MKILLSLSLLLLSGTVYSQCKIEILKPNGQRAMMNFYIIQGCNVKCDTLNSTDGVMNISKEIIDKYPSEKFTLFFSHHDETTFKKLYKKPEKFREKNTLRNLCGEVKLEEKTFE